MDAEASLCITIFLIAVTMFFEVFKDSVEEWVEEKNPNLMPVISAIWGELTVLGFIALITFFMLKAGTIQGISEVVFHEEEHLVIAKSCPNYLPDTSQSDCP